MHAAPVAAFAAPGTTAAAFGMSEPGRRTVYYGYIATGRRERMVTALTDQRAVAELQSIDPSRSGGPTLGALWARVISAVGRPARACCRRAAAAKPPPPGTDTDYSSLYILLDLDDWLQNNLPAVYKALVDGTEPERRGRRPAGQALASRPRRYPGSVADQPPPRVPGLPAPVFPSFRRCTTSPVHQPWSPGQTSAAPAQLPAMTSCHCRPCPRCPPAMASARRTDLHAASLAYMALRR